MTQASPSDTPPNPFLWHVGIPTLPPEHKTDAVVILPLWDNDGILGLSQTSFKGKRLGVVFVLHDEVVASFGVTRLSKTDLRRAALLLSLLVDGLPSQAASAHV